MIRTVFCAILCVVFLAAVLAYVLLVAAGLVFCAWRELPKLDWTAFGLGAVVAFVVGYILGHEQGLRHGW